MLSNTVVTWILGIGLIAGLCVWFGFKGAQYLRHLKMNSAFKQAMANEEFEIYYQPIIDLKNGRVGGIEALLRWTHPTRGAIPPAEFIPLAEKSGMILEIGEWVLERSAMQTLAWHNQGYSALSLKVGVNLSSQQLKQGNLLATLDKVMKKTGLGAAYLDLEISEQALIDKELAPRIHAIEDRGITLSLDDFGTGFSGLNYLQQYNIGTIKIDRSLIQKLNTKRGAMIVSAILAMARELNIKTHAVGVETGEQLEFLQKRGCLLVQGYYFCKPLNVDKFTRLLGSHLRFFEQAETSPLMQA
jgi:EAL domain-containing protein (putative c-di-GMP-specific phosphodiesterase class I)